MYLWGYFHPHCNMPKTNRIYIHLLDIDICNMFCEDRSEWIILYSILMFYIYLRALHRSSPYQAYMRNPTDKLREWHLKDIDKLYIGAQNSFFLIRKQRFPKDAYFGLEEPT